MIKTYKDLLVWQKSVRLAEEIYSLTESFPQKEVYGIISQMRRASIAIPSNIAEGRGRSTRKDFINFLHISLGSALELETQLTIAKKLNFGLKTTYTQVESLLLEIIKMLSVMIYKLKANN